MFKRLEKEGVFFGHSLENGPHHFFFGSRHCTREKLSELFPQYEFCFLKQVHGRRVVEGQPETVHEADAHFTTQRHRAVVAQSADCLPILLATKNQVCAVHAGWKGVAQNIVKAVHQTLPEFRPQVLAIGPHITRASFEIGQDVAELLFKAAPTNVPRLTRPALTEGKVFFDLNALVQAQAKAAFGASVPFIQCCDDTKTDHEFHSYRRDGAQAQRQYSFVVLNS